MEFHIGLHRALSFFGEIGSHRGFTQQETASMNFFRAFIRDESGATAIEYGLIAALVSVGIIAMLGFIGDELLETFTEVRDGIANR